MKSQVFDDKAQGHGPGQPSKCCLGGRGLGFRFFGRYSHRPKLGDRVGTILQVSPCGHWLCRQHNSCRGRVCTFGGILKQSIVPGDTQRSYMAKLTVLVVPIVVVLLVGGGRRRRSFCGLHAFVSWQVVEAYFGTFQQKGESSGWFVAGVLDDKD